MSENWQQSEICIVINDKSQDSTAKHLSYDGLLHYKFVSHCAGKIFFLMIRRPPRSTRKESSAASDVYKRQVIVPVKEFLKSVNIWRSYRQNG